MGRNLRNSYNFRMEVVKKIKEYEYEDKMKSESKQYQKIKQ